MARRNLSTDEAVAVYDRAKQIQTERRGGHIRQLLVEARRELFGGGATFDDGDSGDDSSAVSRRLIAQHRVLYPHAGNASLAILIPAAAITLIVGSLLFAFRGSIAEFSSPTAWHQRIAR